MRFELPECRRCFFCVPLRYGIILFGYLNLAFALLVISVDVKWLIRSERNWADKLMSESQTMFRGAAMYGQIWLPLVMYGMEVIFNIILLVGAHAEKPKLMRIYYYYSITTTISAIVILLVVRHEFDFMKFEVIEACLAFLGLVTQIYLTLLIHNELSKKRYQEGRMSYVNHMSEITFHPAAWVDSA